YLRTAARAHPDLMDSIVEHHLLNELVEAHPIDVSAEELQAGADRFRRVNRLSQAADTERWLRETRLSPRQFEDLIEEHLKRDKAKQALIDERIDAYFAAHRARFDTLVTCEVTLRARAEAERVLSVARSGVGLQTAAEEWLRSESAAAEGACAIRTSPASECP